MPNFLIPLLIAGAILAPLGILLWWGARERRRFVSMHDDDLGEVKLFKTHWEAADSWLFGQHRFSVSGTGRTQGPTATQKVTLNFVKANVDELFRLAVAAVRDASAEVHVDELRISGLFLDGEPNSFELSLEFESCAAEMPDGVAVSFIGKQIDNVEVVH